MLLLPGVYPTSRAMFSAPILAISNTMACRIYRAIRLGFIQDLPSTISTEDIQFNVVPRKPTGVDSLRPTSDDPHHILVDMTLTNPPVAPLGKQIADVRSTSDSTLDCDSCASTTVGLHDHEQSKTFVYKVRTLLVAMFPNDLPIKVEHIHGGRYNSARGVLGHDQQCPRRVIVHIPQFTGRSLVNEAAVLRFLESNTTIAVPRVLHFHKSPSNIISDPFMILEHPEGTCLGDVYDDMPSHMKKFIVRSLANVMKQFSEVTFDAIGTLLSASPDSLGIEIGHAVRVSDETQFMARPSPARARSIRSYLEERWSFFVAEEQCRNPGDTFDLRFIPSFRAAMERLPLPDPDTPARIVLHHTDLTPHNILIDARSGAITGVSGWDLAESAPVEAAWQMPAWLWDKEASGSTQPNWVSPDDIPLDPQAAEIKQLFLNEIEDAIPDFVQTVRHSKHIFELLTFARLGLHSEEIIYRARDFIARMNIEIAPVAQYP